jgi:hypothetical protein
MRPELLAFFYGGPDQIMPLQTTLAAAVALLLIFWNKGRVLLARAWERLRNGRVQHSVDCKAKLDRLRVAKK